MTNSSFERHLALSGAWSAADTLGCVRSADETGVDGFWQTDVEFSRDCYSLLGAIGAATSNIKVAPGVSNPYTRHPAQIAAAIGTLSDITGGRVIAGLGAGGSGLTRIGVVRSDPLTTVAAAVHAIRALLAGERHSVKASTFELNDGALEFPVAKPPPRIAIVAHGKRMYALAGELADIVVIGNYATVEGITWAIEHIRKGASIRSPALGELKVIGRVDVCVADNRSNARDHARKRTRAFLRSGYYGVAFLEPLGLASLAGRDDLGDDEIERVVDATGFAGSTDDVSRGTTSLIDSGLLHGVCARLETVPGGALSDAWHILSQGWAN